MEFNKEQRQAVSHGDGPMLVLAGPGSGKTAVLTSRVCRLIKEHQAAPSSILVVTFTRAAAGQMRERFLQITGESRTQVTFGTFHGIFYGILRHAYGITSENIAGEEMRTGILKTLIQERDLDVDDEKDLLEAVGREISEVKNGRILLEHYHSRSCSDEEFRRIYREYKRQMRRRRLLDYDDLMVSCWNLFQRHPQIREAWQKKFRYILIDEFQDVNLLQYDIIKLLAYPENNLFVVGDDDQSIYRFRGAKPEIMLGFPRDFPDAGKVILKTNYRCTREIVEKSQNLIRHNTARFEKGLVSRGEKGTPVEIRSFDHESQETAWLLQQIQKDLREGCFPREIAVLFRTNVGCRMTVERLMEYQIPFTMRDALPNLYEHWLARNMISYIRLAMGERRREDFLAVMNRPNRYLSREALYQKEMTFEILYQFYEEKPWMCSRIETFEQDVKYMKEMSPFAAVNYIRKGIGYDDYLKEYAAYRKLKAEDLYELLDEIQESARGFRTFREWFAYMEEYKRKLREQAERIRMEKDAVTISTFHSVKGLEFNRVYIMDVNEGTMPYHKAVLEEDLEEERRMFYVGMTRAREQLHLYYVKERFGKERIPSRFLEELEEE